MVLHHGRGIRGLGRSDRATGHSSAFLPRKRRDLVRSFQEGAQALRLACSRQAHASPAYQSGSERDGSRLGAQHANGAAAKQQNSSLRCSSRAASSKFETTSLAFIGAVCPVKLICGVKVPYRHITRHEAVLTNHVRPWAAPTQSHWPDTRIR